MEYGKSLYQLGITATLFIIKLGAQNGLLVVEEMMDSVMVEICLDNT